ncbi:MAG: PQQ-dependent sugar dehydrogenase [Coriobacteriia bacterium]|nr:PQQ-dependent sugar dehydrogenase [Coriobacteriia bacterium]
MREFTGFLFLVLAAFAVSVLVTGCSAGSGSVTGGASPAPLTSSGVVVASATSPAPAPAALATSPVSLANLQLALAPRWSGFTSPVDLANAGDGSGRLFVVEQGGLVKVIESGTVLPTPYLDLRAKVSTGGERGLLGIAFSPTFETDGQVYVDYTDTSGNTAIMRYTAPDPASSAPAWGTPKRMLALGQPYANHNGGCLRFGPDGYLYIGMGDGGSGGDPGNRAQNPDVLLGKILRIDVSRAGKTKPYVIPANNPWKKTITASLKPAPEVWALGVRNPWRFSFDPAGGTMWIGDVGQNAYEEVNFVTASKRDSRATKGGLNFGWRRYEGLHRFPSGSFVGASSRSSKYVWPTFNYHHPTGESVTGGYVYRGADFPALRGTYVFGDFVGGWVSGIRLRAPDGSALRTPEQRRLLSSVGQPSSFGVDERGELYLVDYRGSVLQVTGTAK